MSRRSILATTTAALTLAVGLAVPSASAAPQVAPSARHHVATTTVAHPVTRATVHQIYVAVAADRQMRTWKRADWRIARIMVTPSGTWARTTIIPAKGLTDPATVVLHKVKGQWHVVDLGTSQVGCGIAPASALKTLGLGGC